MARKPVFKTPLGRRLAEVREKLGMEREELAKLLDVVSASAISNYERGDNLPSAEVLSAYRLNFGVDVDWLITGNGDMFIDREKAPAPRMEIDPQLLRKLHREARLAYAEVNHRPPDADTLAVEAGRLYNALLAKGVDLRDQRLVEVVIPLIVDDLRAELRAALDDPGSGKASA